VLHPFATRSNSSFAALLLDVVGVPLAFDLLQDIATTKGECHSMLHFIGIFVFVKVSIVLVTPHLALNLSFAKRATSSL
jgi:hypothetical protein